MTRSRSTDWPEPETGDAPFLQLNSLRLQIESIPVLNELSLEIGRGTVHAVVGEHGAGKTSLCLVLSGHVRPTAGTVRVNGTGFDYLTPARAKALGIEYVPQHTPMVDHFSIARNLFLDNRRIAPYPFVSKTRQIERAQEFLSRLEIDLEPTTLLSELKLSDRVLVDVLKHVYTRPQLLILDEALQKLTAVDFRKIIRYLRQLKDEGTSILFVTHRIDDIYEFADRVSIMRNGEILITDSVEKLDKINLIRLAYTQLAHRTASVVSTTDFVNLLKYNEAVLQKLPVILLVVDKERRLKLVNEQAMMYFPNTETSKPDLTLQTFLGTENTDIYTMIEPAFSSRTARRFFSIPMKHGDSDSIVNIDVHPIYDETFLMGYSVIISDITEQEAMREQVMMSERLASVGLLAAGVAHEINNPLEIIINNLRYIRFKNEDEVILKRISNIEDEINDIAAIVRNLISFTKDETEPTADRTSLIDVLTSIIDFVRPEADRRGVTILHRSTRRGMSPGVQEQLVSTIPRTEVKQVLINLIKNGLEAMPEGGTLTVETAADTSRGEAQITVRDEGPGIPKDKLTAVFLPFYSSKHADGQHLGLGLALSYGIVKRNKGSLSVRNLPRSGCEFLVSLPLVSVADSRRLPYEDQ